MRKVVCERSAERDPSIPVVTGALCSGAPLTTGKGWAESMGKPVLHVGVRACQYQLRLYTIGS